MMSATPEAFTSELEQRAPQLIRVALVLGAIAFAVMAVVDPMLIAGPDLHLALASRAMVCTVFVGLTLASFAGDWAKKWARPVSLSLLAVTALEVTLLAYLTGGGASRYHEALHVTMFGYAILPFPWRRWDAAGMFAAILLTYDASLALGDRPGTLAQLLSNNALLGVSALVAATLQNLLMTRQLRDFESRRALAAAAERLKTLDSAKSRFFSNVSHELRTPLTLIVAPLEALLDSTRDPLSAGQRERAGLAQRNALRLLRLVDDLLSLSKAEASSLKLHVADVDLGYVVRSFTADVEELAARKRIVLTTVVPETPCPFEGDVTLIERVLLNLVGNSAKFVPIGGHIDVVLESDRGEYEIRVADDGIGIPQAALPHIFDRFYQADHGGTRSVGGTGIGLSLVREIVELHGGRVAVTSELGHGTTVCVRLPSHLPPDRRANAVRADDPGSATKGLPEWHEAIRSARSYRLQGIDEATERRVAPRPPSRENARTVLVVEDNPDMVRFLVALLAYDYNVLTASNGVQGLRMALERKPDLIISDVMMPEMDGLEMCRRLRSSSGGGGIPLIFLTARGSSEDRVQGHAGGADTYLAKPFRSEELLAAVASLLARQDSVRESSLCREDEALVFMASGLVEELGRAAAALNGATPPPTGPVPAVATSSATGPLPRIARREEPPAARIERLANALRALAEAGTQPVRRPAALDETLERIAHPSDTPLPTGRALHVNLNAPIMVPMAESELRAVIQPILDRALQVTPTGRDVRLHSECQYGKAAGGAIIGASVVIRDEGPSLSPDQIERFFFPFGLNDGRTTSGLELARVRHTVLARGGTIAVEPLEPLGTAVSIHLPVVSTSAPWPVA